ncbi:MAG: SIMPL domain-containing protein [Bacillota bacterium]
MSNKILYSILIILVIIFGFLFITNQNMFIYNNVNVESTMNLSSQKEMEFSPDRVNISLGVETRSEKLEDAKNENNKKINSLKEVLEKYDKIEVSNISFNVYPIYENDDNNQQDIKYYRVRNILEIKIFDLDITSNIIDDSLKSGANIIYNLQYSLENENEARQEVIEKALIGLENKAKHIKNNLNKNDYKLKNLTVDDNLQRNTMYFDNMKTNLNESSMNSTTIDPANIKISVTIRGEYILID